MAKDFAIVLSNGSTNSAVAASLAAQKYRTIMLHAEIADAAGSRARASYDQQVVHFKPYREHSLPMPFLSVVMPANAAAINRAAMADPRFETSPAPQLVNLVPILGAAARFAAHYQAVAIYLGLRVGPGSDELAQATEYIQIWTELLQLPCGQPDLTIEAPLMEFEPWQVVDLGFQTHAPFEKTWSCLEEGSEPCWACRGCRDREIAFQRAGKPDPLRAVKKG